jgi:hypothetical protein
VKSKLDEVRQRYSILVDTRDDRSFWARELSDGTLCLLAVVFLANDPEHKGVVFFEEPEFGIHPSLQKQIVPLLRNMTTDFVDSGQAAEPLKQLLVATQSPVLVSELNMHKDELLFADLVTRVRRGQPSIQVTRMYPVQPDTEQQTPEGAYTLARVLDYLSNMNFEAKRSSIRDAIMR